MGNVYPVNKHALKVKVSESFIPIANMESLEISFDTNIETWNAMENGGAQSAQKTAYAMSISGSAKRTVGDAGQETLVETTYLVGEEANREFEWTKPDGSKETFTAVVSIDSMGGDSTAVDALEFTLTAIGTPESTSANA